MAQNKMTKDTRNNKLNRELLRWIQSLDLAYSIKNVKRDFANGFLVAEILSRYYDKDISMHSYDNGIGMKVRKDNWDQLTKIFGRFVDLEPLNTKNDIDAIIHCQNGFAVAFLTKLYQCLTKRTIQSTVVNQPPQLDTKNIAAPSNIARSLNTSEEIPPYAKPTNSAFIRDKMRESEFTETLDQVQLNRKVCDIHSQLDETHQLERLMAGTPDRYSALGSASKATVLRGARKTVCHDGNSPGLMTEQIVREVQIKTVNQERLEKLRATREAKEIDLLALSDSQSSIGDAGGGVTTLNANYGATKSEFVQRRRPFDLLNERVENKILSMGLTLNLRGGKDKFECFLETSSEGQYFGELQCIEVLRDIEEEAESLGLAFLEFPRDFWKFVGLMYPFLAEYDEAHEFFQITVHLFVIFGQQCACRDGTAASLLMSEYLLPKLTPILRRNGNKRASLLRTLYAFLPDTVLAHIQAIKHLREAMADDIPLFIHMLTILIGIETELDEALVDLYHYYCSIGLETSCETLRAACLSMLVPLLSFDINLVVDLLPRINQFSSRHAWWEVKAQLVIVAAALLRVAPAQQMLIEDGANKDGAMLEETAQDFTEQIELCLTIIEREFHSNASLNLRRVGLSALARNLEQYQELVPLYVDVLLSLPVAVRHTMLVTADAESLTKSADASGTEHQLPLQGTSGATYRLLPLVPNWDSVAIAKQLYYDHRSSNEADPGVLHVIYKCLEELSHTGKQLNVQLLYDQMKDYVATGFITASTCEHSASIVMVALAASIGSEIDVFQHVALVDALQQVITKNVEDLRQQTIVEMLLKARAMGPLRAEQVQHFVTILRSKCDVDTYKSSLFSISLDIKM